MKLTYSFPSRSRPVKFFAALDNIRSMSSSNNYEVIAKLDIDDKTFTDRFKARLSEYPEVIVKWGKSKNKVHAVNRDLEGMTGEILMLHSDDMVFIKRGFDDLIRKEFGNNLYVHRAIQGTIYEEPLFDGLLHFPDGFANERVCTYSIMHVSYYKRFGYIYHPDYISMWCDNEQTEVAKKLNKYKFVSEQILQHEHPVLGHVPKDEMYQKDGKFYRMEEVTFKRGQNMNFGL
jgi:hypothetical protein